MFMIRGGIAAVVSAALFVSAVPASAQVSLDDAKCRSSFQKSLTKYNATIHKAIAGCWKDVFKGKLPTDTDCNTLGVADAKGKAGKAKLKLEDQIGGDKTKCKDDVNSVALAEFSGGCPSPAAGPISSWLEARDCAIAITEFQADQAWRFSFDPPEADVIEIVNDKALNGCASAIQKSIIKLAATAAKERGKSQATSDKLAGSYDFLAGNSDDGDKIANAEAKLASSIESKCGGLSKGELAALNSCRSETSGLEQCLTGVWERNGSGVASMAYEQAGICPATVIITADAGKGGGRRLNETRFDAGWTGIGHDVDLTDGFKVPLSLSCADSTCGTCSPTLLCDPVVNNCRCSNDVTVACTMPNTADPACGGGNCDYLLSPPLPLSASNAPACAINKIVSELVAAVPTDIGAGTTTTGLDVKAVVHSGIAQNRPCPVCSGAAIGDMGTCTGGSRNGLSCRTDAIHFAFGRTSYDCPPDPGANVSGSGLTLNLVLSDAPPDLTMGTDCTFGGGGSGLKCACAICTGGGNIPCNGDGDCPGGETCTSPGSGQQTQPNDCSDLICTDRECAAGASNDFVTYCDGYVRGDGQGILTCTSNADCITYDPICPNGDCGTCTLSAIRPCFTSGGPGEVISGSGVPGTDGAVLASNFCIPPSSSTSINAASGLPGPARIFMTLRYDNRCPNDDPWQFPGGSNCQ